MSEDTDPEFRESDFDDGCESLPPSLETPDALLAKLSAPASPPPAGGESEPTRIFSIEHEFPTIENPEHVVSATVGDVTSEWTFPSKALAETFFRKLERLLAPMANEIKSISAALDAAGIPPGTTVERVESLCEDAKAWPKTADGMRVRPGMMLYLANNREQVFSGPVEEPVVWPGCGSRRARELYSTALAARRAADAGEKQ